MGRNTFETTHRNCPSNDGKDYPFKVRIGQVPICPKCGEEINLGEPFFIKGEKEFPVPNNINNSPAKK